MRILYVVGVHDTNVLFWIEGIDKVVQAFGFCCTILSSRDIGKAHGIAIPEAFEWKKGKRGMLACNFIGFACTSGIGDDTPIVNLIPVRAGKVCIHGSRRTGVGHAMTFHLFVVIGVAAPISIIAPPCI